MYIFYYVYVYLYLRIKYFCRIFSTYLHLIFKFRNLKVYLRQIKITTFRQDKYFSNDIQVYNSQERFRSPFQLKKNVMLFYSRTSIHHSTSFLDISEKTRKNVKASIINTINSQPCKDLRSIDLAWDAVQRIAV